MLLQAFGLGNQLASKNAVVTQALLITIKLFKHLSYFKNSSFYFFFSFCLHVFFLCLSFGLSTYPPTCLSVCLPSCLSVCLSVCLVCLSLIYIIIIIIIIYLFIYLPNPLTNLHKIEGYHRKWNIFMKVSFPIITLWNDLASFHKITKSSSSNM